MDYNSENYALQLEINENKNHQKYNDYLIKKMTFIDERLKINDGQSRIDLILLLSDEEFMSICSSRNDFAEVIQIIRIFLNECKQGVQKTLLDLVHGKDNLIHVLNTLKFILIRIEFSDEEEGTILLKNFLARIPLSAFALKTMISWCNINIDYVESIAVRICSNE